MDTPAHETERPFQFSLIQLVVFMVLICLGLGMYRAAGGAAAYAYVVICLMVVAIARDNWRTAAWVGAIGGLGLGVVFFTAAAPRGPHYTTYCHNRLRSLAAALLAYEIQHGSLPPAYVVDDAGRPMHSWRVLILPQLEEQWTFEKYDFTEPWDGPNNAALAAASSPSIFRCPYETGPPQNTSYVAVVGPNTCWPGPTGRDLDTISDGADATILLVELPSSGIRWMEPRDLTVDEFLQMIDTPDGLARFRNGAHAAFVSFGNAAVYEMPADIDAATLRALLTINGGEEVEFGTD